MILNLGSSIKDDSEREYILDEVIGHGGFGYVFKAHRKSDNAIFAVKTMLPSFGDASTEMAFKNEIQTAMQVHGENIIHYEFVHNGDTFTDLPPYIIMEYAEGGTLTSFLEQKRTEKQLIETNELLCIFKQLANGMLNISTSLVHRDIKPDNILLSGGLLKISDFGLSKIAAEDTRTRTFKGGGTPQYMAPEAWDFTKNTIQMDIYSMGIVFYELASLRYPYDPIPRTWEDCRNSHLYSPIINLEKVNPKLPANIISIVNRMLEKSAKRRFSNWQEIISALEAQVQVNSPVDKLVTMAVATTNAQDSARQAEESARKLREKERNDFCKLVHSQFDSTIIAPLIDFAEKFNLQYAGQGKVVYSSNSIPGYDNSYFSWEMSVPASNEITIDMEIIFKENHSREVLVDSFFGDRHTRSENYIPQYKNKNILAWGEIKNTQGYGFNILLVDSGEIYGDWIIMNNKNNFSSWQNCKRPEPFAFTLRELPSEINNVQITHLYSADFVPFDKTCFLSQIKQLAFDLC